MVLRRPPSHAYHGRSTRVPQPPYKRVTAAVTRARAFLPRIVLLFKCTMRQNVASTHNPYGVSNTFVGRRLSQIEKREEEPHYPQSDAHSRFLHTIPVWTGGIFIIRLGQGRKVRKRTGGVGKPLLICKIYS